MIDLNIHFLQLLHVFKEFANVKWPSKAQYYVNHLTDNIEKIQ